MTDVPLILVVEDDPTISELLVDFLTEEGYEVVAVRYALQALVLLNQNQFKLITLDLGLPDIDGNEFLSRLSTTGKFVPVVVVSATPHLLIPNQMVRSVVPKPFDLDNLGSTIKQYALA